MKSLFPNNYESQVLPGSSGKSPYQLRKESRQNRIVLVLTAVGLVIGFGLIIFFAF